MAPLTAEQLWSIPRVGAPAVAAGRIVVPVATTDLDTNASTTTLWEVFTDERTPRRLTTASAGRPLLSPDGATLAFVRKVGDHAQLHLLAMDGGEARQVTDFPLGVIGAKFLPDGSGLVVLANLFVGHLTTELTAAERDRRADSHVDAHTTDGAVFRYWDRWLTTGEVPHLFLVTPGDQGDVGPASSTVVDLTPDSERWMPWDNTADPVDEIDIAPDGSAVLWTANRADPTDPEIRWAAFETTIDVRPESDPSDSSVGGGSTGAGNAGATRCLTEHLDGHASRPRYTPDGTAMLYGAQANPHFYADRTRLTLHDLATGAERELTPEWDRSPMGWTFIDGGSGLLVAAEDDARVAIWKLSGDVSTASDAAAWTVAEVARDATLGAPDVLDAAAATLITTRSSVTAPPEVVTVTADGEVTAITSFTADALADVDLPTVTDVRYPGADGVEVQMFVVSPPGASDEPLPLVHMIHGGPHGAWDDVWHWRWNPAVFCGATRRAALVNFHGSTGWGQDFAATIRGEWGDKPTADVNAATDHLITAGLVDPERTAITGGSYGGYLVSWLIGQTDRYRCAVAHAAVTDLPAMYASDITMGRAESYGAEPYVDHDRVNRWSPMAHAADIVTPTLVIHGDRDYRVPVGQGLALYGLLHSKGVPTRLVHYPGENHWVLSAANSVHWYGEVTAWLDRFGV